MALSGVKWSATDEEIKDAFKKSKGVITKAAKILNVIPNTIYERLKETPELKEFLEKERHAYSEHMLDAAENCLMYAVSKKEEDLGNALKSSFFILNNKGKERGYSSKNNPNSSDEVVVNLSDFDKWRDSRKGNEDEESQEPIE